MADFTEAVRTIVNSRLSTVFSAMPAVIESYSGGKATVKPAINISGSDKMPVLSDVPVVFPNSSSAGIVFEVSKGDPVLLVFSCNSIDEWLQSNGKDTETDDPRRFDITDAIAIPGLFPFGSAPELSTSDGCVMRYKDTSVTIKKNGDVQIGGASAKKLINEEFKSVFNNHTHDYVDTKGTVATPSLTGSPHSDPAGLIPIQITNNEMTSIFSAE